MRDIPRFPTGLRNAALTRLRDLSGQSDRPPVALITTGEALAYAMPAPSGVADTSMTLAVGDAAEDEALVDRLIIFRAPLVLGGGALNAFGSVPPTRAEDALRWRLLGTRRFGDDEMSVYAPPD